MDTLFSLVYRKPGATKNSMHFLIYRELFEIKKEKQKKRIGKIAKHNVNKSKVREGMRIIDNTMVFRWTHIGEENDRS